MKKQILNLGKVLNKNEQKDILGGLSFPKKEDECENLTEFEYDPNCPCFTDSQCPRVFVKTEGGHNTREGVCSEGKCVAA